MRAGWPSLLIGAVVKITMIPVGLELAKAAGVLCGKAGTRDVVDASCDLFGRSVAGAKRHTAVLARPTSPKSAVMCHVTDADRELLRAIFGQDAELYDQARPGYPDQMFADLAQLAELNPQSRVLELGCGTGQATRPLARLGCTIVAVELSPDMATVARRNLHDCPNVTVEVSPFEEWRPPATPFDLVVSATSFHWIDPDIRVHKAANVLRPGATVAVAHSEHIAGGTERFFIDVQDCYERFDPKTLPGLRPTPAAGFPDDSSEFDRSQRFGPAEFRRYEWEQAYSTRSYLDLLMTYSPTRSLARPARDALLSCIGGLIDRDHNGQISKRYVTQLTVAHRTT